MELTKHKLGNLIELVDHRNENLDYGLKDVRGISIKKEFIETKANMEGVSLSSYKIVSPNDFAYVTVTSRNGKQISLALNKSQKHYLVSSTYLVFRLKNSGVLIPDYLYIYFNRPEFDRFSRYNSWGSARETFDWNEMQSIEIELPSIEIQQKYVNIYKAMVDNQKNYENGLEDLKFACEAYIDKLKKEIPAQQLGDLIVQCNNRNDDLKYSLEHVRGISIEKRFIPTTADMKDVSLKPYLLVKPDEFAYVTVTSRNGRKISIAHNASESTYLCSSSYIVFRVNSGNVLIPDYLSLFLSRSEFDRYARYNSWGSARETFDWSEMCDVKIPLPSFEIQQSIVNIFKAYNDRNRINEQLKEQIKSICPILIKGSIEEARKA